jgi:hypothetical protein
MPDTEAHDTAPELATWPALARNLRAGLRTALLLPTRHRDVVATWPQFALLLALSMASVVVWELVATGVPAHFHPTALPNALFALPLVLLACLAITAMARRSSESLPFLIAIFAAGLWLDFLVSVAQLAAQGLPGRFLPYYAQWTVFYGAYAWLVACIAVAAARRFGLGWASRIAAALIAFVVAAWPLMSADHEARLWTKVAVSRDDELRRDYDAVTREDVLYLQPKLLERDVAALLPRQEGRPNLYLVGVAGYAYQDVFRREVDAVDALFAERFGTRGRSLRLVNNPATVRDVPIATHTSLSYALRHIGSLMNRDEDVLFLFLTSHGSKDGRLSVSFYPLQLTDIRATELRQMLDDAGIRNRVVVVSACYSGAFVDAFRDDDTMVLTASARDRNSFGCSNEADFTYFSKAYFDEALRTTDSFSEAFDRALPLIAQREKKEDYTPSNPQRYVGARIEATLAAWREANRRAQ